MLEENIIWLKEFKNKYGRAPRILHIGNIANNAYNNVKLLNEVGFDCDVICYDYYHIAGCPEWEDANFDARKIKDQFFPNWLLIDTGSFKRPRWFAQGKLKYCILYLISKRKGKKFQSSFWWMLLRIANFFTCYLKSSKQFGKLVIDMLSKISSFQQRIKNIFSKIISISMRLIAELHLSKNIYKSESQEEKTRKYSFEERCQQLVDIFNTEFPERHDKLKYEELVQYSTIINSWLNLFSHYDLVHAYATDGIFPLLANKPYVAYEHGTIRDLPFNNSITGRLCALTYKLANQVLITNADNVVAAKKLNLSAYHFVPHPINESSLSVTLNNGESNFYKEIHKTLKSDFIVFHPPRQHWETQRNPSMDKGNDIFIKGFAKFVQTVNPSAKAIFVEWGITLNESKNLIKELGIESSIVWIKPQNHQNMMKFIEGSDIVADKFCFGGFGGIPPKALMSHKITLIYIDLSIHEWCFEEMPPFINAETPQNVFESLQKVYTDKSYRSEVESQGKSWYIKYHSSSVIINTIQNTYKSILLP